MGQRSGRSSKGGATGLPVARWKSGYPQRSRGQEVAEGQDRSHAQLQGAKRLKRAWRGPTFIDACVSGGFSDEEKVIGRRPMQLIKSRLDMMRTIILDSSLNARSR